MNTKVVIVWIIAVIVFAGIGLFGMANQHLLDEKPAVPTPTNPNVDSPTTTHTVSCSAMLPNGNSSYNFTIDDSTNSITNVNISYQTTSQVDYIRSSANNLAAMQVNGITTNLSEVDNGFTLIMNVNLLNYDATSLTNFQTDLANVSAVIENIGNYETYQTAINNAVSSLGSVYNCN